MTSLLDLALLRLHVFEAEKLRWFFCQAEGELGLQSGMALQLERARVAGGRNKGSKPLGSSRAKGFSDDQLEAAFEFANVSRRLARLTPHDAQVLRVHYGPLMPVHRQHEPTHDALDVGPRTEITESRRERARVQPLGVFGPHLGLVLHLTAAQGIPVEKVLSNATTSEHGKGQKKEAARLKVQAWLREAEQALVQASAAYAATRHLMRFRRDAR